MDSLCTQNHQEFYSTRELILLGVKVYFNDKWGGLVFFFGFHNYIKPLRSEFYFESIKLGGGGVEVEHLRDAQLFLSSEVFLIFP